MTIYGRALAEAILREKHRLEDRGKHPVVLKLMSFELTALAHSVEDGGISVDFVEVTPGEIIIAGMQVIEVSYSPGSRFVVL